MQKVRGLHVLILVILIFTNIKVIAQESACEMSTPVDWTNYFVGLKNGTAGVPMSTTYLKRQINNCANEIERNEDLQVCTEHIRNYIKYKPRSGGIGFAESDQAYLNSLPDWMRDLPDFFDQGLSGDWKARADAAGWDYLEYTSRSFGNPGTNRSFRRVLFYKEFEDGKELWVQLTAPDVLNPDDPERLIDVIGTERIKPQGIRENFLAAFRPPQSKIYFNQFWRDQNGQNPAQRQNFDRCISCHPNGMREIRPLPGSLGPEGEERLSRMNQRMHDVGGVDWGEDFDPKYHGPALGGPSCTRCHKNGGGGVINGRYPITPETSTTALRTKMHHEMSMPELLATSEFYINFEFDKFEDLPEEVRVDFEARVRRGEVSQEDVYAEMAKVLNEQGILSDSKYEKFKERYAEIANWTDENFRQWLEEWKSNPQVIRNWLATDYEDCLRRANRYLEMHPTYNNTVHIRDGRVVTPEEAATMDAASGSPLSQQE